MSSAGAMTVNPRERDPRTGPSASKLSMEAPKSRKKTVSSTEGQGGEFGGAVAHMKLKASGAASRHMKRALASMQTTSVASSLCRTLRSAQEGREIWNQV